MEHPIIDENKMSPEQKRFYDDYLFSYYESLKNFADKEGKAIATLRYALFSKDETPGGDEGFVVRAYDKDNNYIGYGMTACPHQYIHFPNDEFIETESLSGDNHG